MEIQNSRPEYYLQIYLACYTDVASSANIPNIERQRDIDTIKRRYYAEGLAFFTQALPRLGKSLDEALSGSVRLQHDGFARNHHAATPRFLRSLFSRAFDTEGYIRSDADASVLGWLRQLLFIFYKLELPYKEEKVSDMISSFLNTNEEVASKPPLDNVSGSILKEARGLLRRITYDVDLVNIMPKHGPGVVSTGQNPEEKRFFSRIVRKLEKRYPLTEYFFFNPTHLSDRVHELPNYSEVDTGTAKLIPVPKDSRGPRLISAEPLENQWIQQGQMRALVHHLETHQLTRGHINFRDQSINGELALSGSQTGDWVTLDMKEASDRVSVWLVKELFHSHQYELLDASRSEHTMLPDGTKVPLHMFAPMGSAVCFPIEALVFWCLSVATITRIHNVSLEEARRSVYVYGDDIICRSEYHAAIKQYLPHYGLRFNESKCCTTGFFRESCGVDAYKGIDITPTKFSCVWCSSPDINKIASYVAYSNEMHHKGYYLTARAIESLVHATKLGRKVPYQQRQVEGIAFVRPGSDTRRYNNALGVKTRWNSAYQRLELIAPTCKGTYVRVQDHDWEEVLYRWTKEESVFEWMLPPALEGFPTLLAQLCRHFGNIVDRQVADDTKWYQINPSSPDSSVGVYAVRHRNRSQCRWVEYT